jgi:hypothetical protein
MILCRIDSQGVLASGAVLKSQKGLYSCPSPRHLDLDNAEDPSQCTYLRNLKKKKKKNTGDLPIRRLGEICLISKK